MRGRKPVCVEVSPEDVPTLERMVRQLTAPAFPVRQARTLLEAGRVRTIAVRRTCLRYERGGLEALFGSIERQEFEYQRLGLLTMRFHLLVHSGEMSLTFPESKSAINDFEELADLDQSQHAKMIRQTHSLNVGHDSCPETLTPRYFHGADRHERPRVPLPRP